MEEESYDRHLDNSVQQSLAKCLVFSTVEIKDFC